jgi:hypothetical protein
MKALQAPAMHTCPLLQLVPQAPQCVGSFCRSTQAVRVPRSTVQGLKPALQAFLQAPSWHLLLLLRMAGQALPQAPQLSGSVWRLSQLLPQAVMPGEQLPAQAPPAHLLPEAQGIPQPAPQNCGSVWLLMQALPPLTGVQVVGVAAWQLTPQAPAPHEAAPLAAPETGEAQTLAQLPQWSGSVWVLKQPSGGQLAGKAAFMQAKPQLPIEHTAVPLAGAAQVLPQLPQLAVSVDWSTQALPHLL